MSDRPQVVFWLPGAAPRPVGGVRVVYELANRLVVRGVRVAVVHVSCFDRRATLGRRCRAARDFIARRLGRDGGYRVDEWCAVRPEVMVRGMWRPKRFGFGSGAWHVATAWQTAEWVAELAGESGRAAYLVQNDESRFDGVDQERARATWRLPLRRVVTGSWLTTLFPDGDAAVLGQGVDYQASPHFYRAPQGGKVPRSVLMMFHRAEWKRSAAGIRAIRRAEEVVGRLEVTLFGVGAKPSGLLPEHWNYLENPDQSRLAKAYGEAEIFVSPSEVEGFALPPCEAMLGGCACVLTNIGGHWDAGVADVTALMPELGDDEGLAQAIARLVTDGSLRTRLAAAGRERIRTFCWDGVAGRFIRLITGSRVALS